MHLDCPLVTFDLADLAAVAREVAGSTDALFLTGQASYRRVPSAPGCVHRLQRSDGEQDQFPELLWRPSPDWSTPSSR